MEDQTMPENSEIRGDPLKQVINAGLFHLVFDL